jgi:hypothetical protein
VKKEAVNIEDKANPRGRVHGPLWTEFQEQAKNDPELAKKLQVAERIAEKYSDALQRLAES